MIALPSGNGVAFERVGMIMSVRLKSFASFALAAGAPLALASAQTAAPPQAVPQAPVAPVAGQQAAPAEAAPQPVVYPALAWQARDAADLIPDRPGLEIVRGDAYGNVGPTIGWAGVVVGGWAVRTDGTVALELVADRGRACAEAVDAAAFTVGRDIVFGAGLYRPGDAAGGVDGEGLAEEIDDGAADGRVRRAGRGDRAGGAGVSHGLHRRGRVL